MEVSTLNRVMDLVIADAKLYANQAAFSTLDWEIRMAIFTAYIVGASEALSTKLLLEEYAKATKQR